MKTLLALCWAISSLITFIGIVILAMKAEYLILLGLPVAINITFTLFSVAAFGDKWCWLHGTFDTEENDNG